MPLDLGDLRSQIEQTASDGAQDAGARVRELRFARDQLVDLLGRVDTYLGDSELQREATALAAHRAEQASAAMGSLREALAGEADRDELLDLELADLEPGPVGFDPDELPDRAPGRLTELLSVTRWGQDVLLPGGVAVRRLARAYVVSSFGAAVGTTPDAAQAADMALVEAFWDPLKHPRGRGGKFRDVFGEFRHVGGVEPTGVGGHWKAVGPGSRLAIKPTKTEAVRELWRMRASAHANKTRFGEDMPEGAEPSPIVYEEDPKEPFGGDPPAVESARRMILSGNATTRDEFSKLDPKTGERVYDPARRDLHERIIRLMLTQDENGVPGKGKEHRPPTGRRPRVFFTGGGFASGKGGVVGGEFGSPAHRWKPPDAVTLDPDKIKALMPEFKELQKAGDPEANLRVYEEAWDIAQETAHRIQQQGLDVIVDGIGDTSVDEVLGRLQQYRDAGYEWPPKAVYVSSPADVAIRNARMRMEKALKEGKLESIRYIPEDLMRDVHGDVSKMFPKLLERWPGDLELYDTDTFNPETKKFDPPRLTLRKEGGEVEMVSQEQYDEFLSKAKLSHRNAPEPKPKRRRGKR